MTICKTGVLETAWWVQSPTGSSHSHQLSRNLPKSQLCTLEGLQRPHGFQSALQKTTTANAWICRTLTIKEATSKERFPGPFPKARACLQAGEKGLSPVYSPACAITSHSLTHPFPTVAVQNWTCQPSCLSFWRDREGGQRLPKEPTNGHPLGRDGGVALQL